MRKIWLFSYSTTVFRLMKKTWDFAFVQESTKPWNHGAWEHDTQDLEALRDEAQMAFVRADVKRKYPYATTEKHKTKGKGKEKAATEVPQAPEAPDIPQDTPRALESAEEYDTLRDMEPQDDDRGTDTNDFDIGDEDDVRIRKMIPVQLREQLKQDYIRSGKPTTYQDNNGNTKKMTGKFYVRYRMKPFPEGFWFQHIILDECQVVRNPSTGWSRAVRMMIRGGYRARTQSDAPHTSLMMVSATPAINSHTDYRGLAGLF